MSRKQPHWFDAQPPDSIGDHACGFPGCLNPAPFRAPTSRHQLEKGGQSWLWFCLDHIRQYNASWNYYEGMSEEEIEQERRTDYTWKRPTWPLGDWGTANDSAFEDPFGLFTGPKPRQHTPRPHSPPSAEWSALNLLGLSYPYDTKSLRTAYRTMVKKHHPDVNKGTKEAEEMVKQINEAYDFLKNRLAGN
jgi:DnaJ-domain-containing protein 1